MAKPSPSVGKVGLVVALLAVWLSSTGWAQVARDVEQWVLAQQWANVRQALAAEKALANPTTRLLGAYAALATGDYRGATAQFSRLGGTADVASLVEAGTALVQRHPQSAVAQMLRGDALARRGQYAAALVALDEAVRLAPRAALLYNVRGAVRALALHYDAAAADFHHALSLESAFADAHCNLGLVHLSQGAWDQAVASLTQAITLAPDHAGAYNARGVAYWQAGDVEHALQDFTQAIRVHPGFTPAAENQQIVQWYKARRAVRTASGQGAGMHLYSITVVLADPKEMPRAKDFASEMVQARMGQVPDVAKTPQEALAKARLRPVLLESPVVVGNVDSVLGYKVQHALQALGTEASVNVVALNGAAAEAGMHGVLRYLDTTPRGSQGSLHSIQLLTPTRSSPGTLNPNDVPNVRAIVQMGGELSARGISVVAYETLGEPWNIRNVKVFQQEPRIDLYVTPFLGSQGALSVGLPSPGKPLPLSVSLGGANDSAADRKVLERDWSVYRDGNEQHMRAKLSDFGKEYIGGLRPSPQPELRLPPHNLEQLSQPVFSPPDRSDARLGPHSRLPPGALSGFPGDKRQGVAMTADVVKDQPADTSGLFGGAARAQSAGAPRKELLAPFLLFWALSEGT